MATARKPKKKAPKITALKMWIRSATMEEFDELAKRLETTRSALYVYSGGFREMSAERARALELATREMNEANRDLPVIYRTDVNSACRGCEFAAKCLGPKIVVRSEFDYLPEGKRK